MAIGDISYADRSLTYQEATCICNPMAWPVSPFKHR